MFCKFFLLGCFVAFCNSQEHLTCLRTEEVFSNPPAEHPVRIQGSPGKRGQIGSKGSVGQKGSKGERGPIGSEGSVGQKGRKGEPGVSIRGPIGSEGSVGQKGRKGEPGVSIRGSIGFKGSVGQKGRKGDRGIPDNSIVNSLRGEITFLRQQVQDLNQMKAAYYRGYELLGDGWVALFNGYKYKIASSRESWYSSRRTCQNLGGDLAVYGIQSIYSTRILFEALRPSVDSYWVGLNDKESENAWKWVNGKRAINSGILWMPGEPNNLGNEDCVEMHFNNGRQTAFNDEGCGDLNRGICEKRLS